MAMKRTTFDKAQRRADQLEKKASHPGGVTGKAMVSWNAPHQGGKSPSPFDQRENRAEILKRLQPIKGATVDLNNVDGFNGLKLPLRAIADKEARDIFFSDCSWTKEALEAAS